MTYVPPARPSIRVTMTYPYKGGSKAFGQRFFFNGASSLTSGQASTAAAAYVAALKLCMSSNVTFTGWVYYDSGSDVPVYSGSASGAGAISGSTGHEGSPLEVSGLIRFTTDQRSVKNHPIYLFKYIRAALRDVGSEVDTWWATQKTAAGTFAATLIAGVSDGTHTLTLCGPRGASALTHRESTYTTHRDFPNL